MFDFMHTIFIHHTNTGNLYSNYHNIGLLDEKTHCSIGKTDEKNLAGLC